MNDGILSEIRMFAGPFNSDAYQLKDWKLCNGEILPIAGNEILFSLLGDTYGGDRKNNFALPNLVGRIPVGIGYDQEGIPDYYQQGKIIGNETVTLKENQLPSHSHSGSLDVAIPALNKMGSKGVPTNNYLASIVQENMYTDQGNTTLAKFEVPVEVEMSKQLAEVTAPISVMQSYQVVNFIICVNGTYPHRP